MDGTLLNTEDLYTEATSRLLAEYGKGPLTWDIKLDLQGRPGPVLNQILIEKYGLPLTVSEYAQKVYEIQKEIFPNCKFLPGALELLEYLESNNIPMALGTSSNARAFETKTGNHKKEFDRFRSHVVLGDDPRIPHGKGKPHPHIWHACLDSINKERAERVLPAIAMEDCLIFEDAIPGVASGLAAKAHVIWIPHVEALGELKGKEKEILASGGDILTSLEQFDPTKYF